MEYIVSIFRDFTSKLEQDQFDSAGINMFLIKLSGLSCSKLTTSLVNVSLKFKM